MNKDFSLNRFNISKEILIYTLENFNLFDNLAQNDNKKVVVGYVGIYINTDFDLTFIKNNDEWILIK